MQTSKRISDANYRAAKYLPAANAVNYTDAFDLESATPGAEPNLFECELVIPAMPNNVDPAKVVTHTLQDSGDGVTFANVDPQIQARTPGVAVDGSVERTVRFRVPSTIRRFIRLAQAVPADGGDNTGAQSQFNLLF